MFEKSQLLSADSFFKRYLERVGKFAFVFDFDGTLADLNEEPMKVDLPSDTLQDLKWIASEFECKTFILSGRTLLFLQKTFGSEFILAAEHGAVTSSDLDGFNVGKSVPRSVLEQLESLCRRHKGSFIEKKQLSMGWHYRKCQNISARELEAIELKLNGLLAHEEFQLRKFDHVFELVLPQQNKKTYLENLLRGQLKDHFVVCFGDDVGEEELFPLLNQRGLLIAVGDRISHANYFVRSPEELRNWLKELVIIMKKHKEERDVISQLSGKSHSLFSGAEY